MSQVIVVGGGLAGLSAAHQALQNGAKVTLIERNPFCGGNSTKATSGINGTLTSAQISKGIQDNQETFIADTAKSSQLGDPNAQPTELIKVLCKESGPAIDWLINSFGLDLSLVSRLGGHSHERTHRGKEKFPGMTITYALMEKFEQIEKETNGQWARLLTKSKVNKLLEQNGEVVGVEYTNKDGQTLQEHGVVIIATGGYAADFSQTGLLAKERPDLLGFSTTNGDHCDGSGIKFAQEVGANTVDMRWVQVHPTGLVNVKDPNSKTKFLAAEALRGCGGILLDADGNRFCDELGRRDYVSGMMAKGKGPFRLVLNGAASTEIEWHCKHYVGRNLMVRYDNGKDLAKAMGITEQKLADTFAKYRECAQKKTDQWNKKFFHNSDFQINDFFHVAIVCPVVHYCMGGLEIDPQARVVGKNGPIKNLYATGEVCGGVHGKNRLGGNSLLDCVVFGRVSGRRATQDLLNGLTQHVQGTKQFGTLGGAGSGASRLGAVAGQVQQSQPTQSTQSSGKSFTIDEVAKHNTDTDCWCILYDKVYNVTKFLEDHPGGKDAIMLFAGKDATEQFDMLHQKSVIDKYGPDFYVGELKK